MDRFNLNLFFALDAILHSETLTDAARSVHLSQPAMSVSLRKLRGYFGDDLVAYHGGEARFTALAIALKPRIRQILQSSREALDLSLTFDPARDAATVRIACDDVIELLLLGRVMTHIAREAPNVEAVVARPARETVDALLRRGIDVAIVHERDALPDYPRLPLFEDGISCMIWSGNEAIGPEMNEAAYFTASHVAASPCVEDALRAFGRDRRIAVHPGVHAALPQLIIGTDLVATTLTRFATRCAGTLPLRLVPMPVPLPPLRFVAQWQPYRTNEPVLQWLLGQLDRAAQEI